MRYGLTDETIARIQAVFEQYPEVEQAVVFGSRALNRYKPSSDIDLSLMGKTLTSTVANKIANDLDDLLLPVLFDISIYHHITNNDLLDHIQRVGQTLYQKNWCR